MSEETIERRLGQLATDLAHDEVYGVGGPEVSAEEREARLYHEMLQRLTPPDAGPFKKMSQLLSHWIEAEEPPAEPRHDAEVAVSRFLAVMGDMEIGEVSENVLRRFRETLAERPHQRTGQALDVRAVAKSLKAIRALLKWEEAGTTG